MTLFSARSGRATALAVLVVALAACSSDADATPEATEPAATEPEATASPTASEAEATASAAATATDDDSVDATILVADSDLGQILTDADGVTIYYFANDTEGVSNCEGECLANWPPVEADDDQTAGEGVEAELGVLERSDGTDQLTINGFPAYYFAGDEATGDVNGQGVGDVWWVFGADGEPIEQ